MKLNDKRVWVSLVGSLLFGGSALAGLSSVFNFNISFIPDFLGSEIVLKVFLLLAGIILLYDAFSLRNLKGNMRLSSIAAGFIFAFLGAFPLLNQFGMLNFLPFVLEFDLSPAILAGLLLFYSIYLLWDTYLILKQR